MADGVEVTQNDLDIARAGIYIQARALIIGLEDAAETDGELESHLYFMGITEFIENQIQVAAANNAYIRMLCNALNEDLTNA